MLTTLTIDGVSVDVEYHFEGKFYPGNHIDPPEYPELIIDKIEVGGVDITAWEYLLDIWERLSEIANDEEMPW